MTRNNGQLVVRATINPSCSNCKEYQYIYLFNGGGKANAQGYFDRIEVTGKSGVLNEMLSLVF